MREEVGDKGERWKKKKIMGWKRSMYTAREEQLSEAAVGNLCRIVYSR